MTLPPFPVDDQTLDLLWLAINPGPEAERSSLYDFANFFSELGGSDTAALEEEDLTGEVVSGEVVSVYRDPTYTPHCIIGALIEEIRRLRKAAS